MPLEDIKKTKRVFCTYNKKISGNFILFFWMRFKRNDSYNLAQDLSDKNAIMCKTTLFALVRIHYLLEMLFNLHWQMIKYSENHRQMNYFFEAKKNVLDFFHLKSFVHQRTIKREKRYLMHLFFLFICGVYWGDI